MQIYTKNSLFHLAVVSNLVGITVGSVLMYAFIDGIPGQNIIEKRLYVEESQAIDTVEAVSGAVVSVFTVKNEAEVSEGSGFFVSKDGLILTNKHVLVKGDNIKYKVILSDGDEYFADFIGEDPFDDIAVLKIVIDDKENASNFTVADFGDSNFVKVGQKVLAFGNALAQYQNTVTMGIISGKGRQISARTGVGMGASENLSGLLQTDAAINLGNSGGPLVNLSGEVVGMNVAVEESGNSIGFAIPANDLKPVIASIVKYGEVVRPVLGVRFVMLDKNQAKKYEVGIDHGAILVGNVANGELAVISGGSGDEAGLKALDVILEINGKEVTEENPLNSIIRQYSPGDKITLKVYRAGKTMDIDLILKSSKDILGGATGTK